MQAVAHHAHCRTQEEDSAAVAVGGEGFCERPLGFELGEVEIASDASAVSRSVQRVAAALRRVAPRVGTPAWRRLQQRCMAADVGWDLPAACWVELLEEVASGAKWP